MYMYPYHSHCCGISYNRVCKTVHIYGMAPCRKRFSEKTVYFKKKFLALLRRNPESVRKKVNHIQYSQFLSLSGWWESKPSNICPTHIYCGIIWLSTVYTLIGPDSCIPHCLGSSLEFPLKRQSTHTFISRTTLFIPNRCPLTLVRG
jgi:hypothetical protein